MDEQNFVKHLTANFPFRYGKGIGDDTSVVPLTAAAFSPQVQQATPPLGYQLITKDILVENVHFNLEYFTLEEIALRSMAVNISDIAAMGGTPQYFYLGLGFPSGLAEQGMLEFFEGLKKGCEKWQVQLAGGDYSAAPVLFISITMVGVAAQPVYRDGAQEHDLIGITGVTGESNIGLQLIQAGIKDGESETYFIKRHKEVEPGIAKGIRLAPYLNSMIDVSDGLHIDLGRILAASGKGGRIDYENIPVTPQMRAVCAAHKIDESDAVLAGGEDFVLLFTLSPEKEKKLRKQKESLPYYIIGEVTSGGPDGLQVFHHNRELHIERYGYDHFTA